MSSGSLWEPTATAASRRWSAAASTPPWCLRPPISSSSRRASRRSPIWPITRISTRPLAYVFKKSEIAANPKLPELMIKAQAEGIKRYYDDKAMAMKAYAVYDTQSAGRHRTNLRSRPQGRTLTSACLTCWRRRSSTSWSIRRTRNIAAQMKAYDFRKVIDNSVVERLVREHFFEQLFGPGIKAEEDSKAKSRSSRLDPMAEIVLGIGSSHGPLLSTPPEQWDLRAKADRENKKHWYPRQDLRLRDAAARARPGIRRRSDRRVAARAVPAVPPRDGSARRRSSRRPRPKPSSSWATISASFSMRASRRRSPSIAARRSRTCSICRRTIRRGSISPSREIRRWRARGIPGATALADHILDSLAAENFDLAQSDTTPKAAPRGGIPHAYGFLYHSILGDTPPPSVPIILNVHFPHNVPKNRRCLRSGRALHRAIKSFDGCGRVAVMASGGLTHFVIDEELDQKILAAMEKGDESGARGDSGEVCSRSGTAEIKNWYPVIAAMNADGPEATTRWITSRATARKRGPATRWRSFTGT